MVKDRIEAFESSEFYKVWLKVCTAMIFFAAALFMLLDFSSLFLTIYSYVFRPLAIILVASYVLLRLRRDTVEFKLIFLYCVWLGLVRIYDGGIFAENTLGTIATRALIMPFMGFAAMLPSDKRLKCLDCFAIFYCLVYVIIGAVCIYGAIYRVEIMNPLDAGNKLCSFVEGRLEIFEVSCNAVGAWYYMACIFLAYLFFRYRKPLLRVFFVLCFVICYLVLAITYSRSSMLGFSISVGMLLVILAFHYFPLRKNASKAVVLVVMMCLGTLLAYKSFSLSTTLMSEASVSVQTAVQEAPVAESSEKSSSEQLIQTTEVLNERGLNSSGRVELWVAAIQSLKEDPGRIITGTINPAILTDQYIREYMPECKYGYRENHHNAYLDILMSSGLPGLLLIMCFLAVLVVKMIRLFFTENRSVPLSVKSLTVMITGILIFNVFESSLFDYTLNTTVFSIVAGYIPVFEKNLHNN